MTAQTRSLLYKLTGDSAAMSRILSAPTFEARVALIVELGEEYGMSVAPSTVRAFLANQRDQPLSDADLEDVVGGKGEPPG